MTWWIQPFLQMFLTLGSLAAPLVSWYWNKPKGTILQWQIQRGIVRMLSFFQKLDFEKVDVQKSSSPPIVMCLFRLLTLPTISSGFAAAIPLAFNHPFALIRVIHF